PGLGNGEVYVQAAGRIRRVGGGLQRDARVEGDAFAARRALLRAWRGQARRQVAEEAGSSGAAGPGFSREGRLQSHFRRGAGGRKGDERPQRRIRFAEVFFWGRAARAALRVVFFVGRNPPEDQLRGKQGKCVGDVVELGDHPVGAVDRADRCLDVDVGLDE